MVTLPILLSQLLSIILCKTVGKSSRKAQCLCRWFAGLRDRSEEHTSELQSLMRISYAVFCLKKKKNTTTTKLRTTLNVKDPMKHPKNQMKTYEQLIIYTQIHHISKYTERRSTTSQNKHKQPINTKNIPS